MCSSLNIQRFIPLNTFKYWKINHKDFDDIELLTDKPSYIDITDVTPPPPPPPLILPCFECIVSAVSL